MMIRMQYTSGSLYNRWSSEDLEAYDLDTSAKQYGDLVAAALSDRFGGADIRVEYVGDGSYDECEALDDDGYPAVSETMAAQDIVSVVYTDFKWLVPRATLSNDREA